jgi:hypothetical protein
VSKHLTCCIIDSFFVPIDFFREATPESISGSDVRRKEEGWIYFDRNGYLLKDSRRKRRGVEISFIFNENGTGTGTSPSVSTSSAAKRTYKAEPKTSAVRRSPPRATSLKGSQRQTRSPPSAGMKASSSAVTANAISKQSQRRSAPRAEYRPRVIDEATQQRINDDLRRICGDLNDQNKTHTNHLDKNVDGLKEVSRQIEVTIDEVEQVRSRDIQNVRTTTIETLDNLVHKSEGLSSLFEAQSRLTKKQNDFLQKEHHLSNLKHGNSLLNTILNKAIDLNTNREQLYSKFNEILTKDLEDQRTEVLQLLQETEKDSKEVYKSADIDRALSEISHAIKTTAVEEIRKREGLLDKFQREQNRAKEQRDDLISKTKAADENIKKLQGHIGKQQKDVTDKEANLQRIRDDIVKERQGLVQDENRNADLEKKLQELKNRLRFYEQEKLYLLTEKNINSTKVNIQEQLLGERDKAMIEWMSDRIQDETDKKAQLEDKMNQCYSFETKDIIDLFKKEKKLQGEQRDEFITSLRDELTQKLENETVIKGNVDAASDELKKLRKNAKKSPEADGDLNIDHEKLYGDLKEVTLDNLDKNQTLATSKKDVKELEVKIMLIGDDISGLQAQCQELEDFLNIPEKVYSVLEVDESELNRLRKELRTKQEELQALEADKAKLNKNIADSEREYRNIKVYRSQRYTIREEGEEHEEVKASPKKISELATEYRHQKVNMSPVDIRNNRLSGSPTVTREIENIMKEEYYGRAGPKIRKTDDNTFIYGTREFVVWKEGSKLYAKDFEADNDEKEELEKYLKIHELRERQNALKTNLQYLNDDIGSEDDEMAEVGEEFEAKDAHRYGFN